MHEPVSNIGPAVRQTVRFNSPLPLHLTRRVNYRKCEIYSAYRYKGLRTEMTQDSSFLNELAEMMADLRRDVEERQARVDAETSSLTTARRQLHALETTADFYRERHLVPGLPQPEEIQSMTQIEGMIHIAHQGNGIFKVEDVRRLMLQAGKIANPKNASNILYTLIKRSDMFERISPGVYRLKDYPSNITDLAAPSA